MLLFQVLQGENVPASNMEKSFNISFVMHVEKDGFIANFQIPLLGKKVQLSK